VLPLVKVCFAILTLAVPHALIAKMKKGRSGRAVGYPVKKRADQTAVRAADQFNFFS
jgi:hypothetical protein